MIKRLLSYLLLSAFLVPMAWAQSGEVTGTITDAETGETLPGVNVLLTEIDRGAVTNPEGVYSIGNVPPGTYTLRASFVGYNTYETEVTIQEGEAVTHDIEMQTGAVGLEEVVVTGYGTQEGTEVSGSISNVNAEDIEDVPSQNPQSLLQGRAAGVQISSTSGNPGGGLEINIRGEGSINAGNNPLVIVDGVQMSFSQGANETDRSPLNAINPRDIESIEVLKDAAAAAIYGAQASNGVVLITTKSGRQGETQVSVNFEGGARTSIANFDVLSKDEWVDFQVDALGENTFYNNFITQYGYDAGTPREELRSTDWEDFITRRGAHRNVGFTANGGDESTQFYLSGSWNSTEAATKEVKYESYKFRANLNQQLTPKLNLDSKVSLSSGTEAGVCQDGYYINCPWSGIQFEPPITYPYLDNGEYNPNTTFGRNNNMAVVLNEEERPVKTTQIVGSLKPRYNITPWLSLNGTVGLDWQRLYEIDYETPIADPGDGGSKVIHNNTVTNLTGNATLNFNRTFNDRHNVDAVIGTEYRREFEQDNIYGVQGFNNSLLRVADAASEASFFGGSNTEYRLLSFLSNVNYNYDGRYILSFTGRYDGTSRFGEARRFGFFPSVSAAWRLSEEEFFDFDSVDELKFRASYGVNGNSDIGNYASRGLYDVQGSYRGQVGLDANQLENRQLTWEEKRGINLGLDYGLFNSRVNGTFEVYQETTDELLLGRPLPRSSGFGGITQNVGSVENRGVEFSIETVNIQTENFRWLTRFNAGVNQNEVKELTGDQEELNSGSTAPVAVGHALEAWKVPRWAGVNPADGRPMWYDKDGNLTYQPTEEDEKFFDGGEEDVEGGFGTRLSYHGLSLDVQFQFSYGAHSRPTTLQFFLFEQGAFSAGHGLLTERWKEPGDITEVPKAVPFGNYSSAADFDATSTYWLYDTSYLRLKNARLSYSLPSNLAGTVGLRDARIYMSGTNLLTWTSYLGLDPEIPGRQTASSYPNERQINFGIELGL